MHGYRAARAFDGERVLTDGVLVLVEGGSIVGVEPCTAPAPAGCSVTDLPGTTLLPGLVDAHVHLCADNSPRALDQLPELGDDELDAIVTASLAAQLASGVTAVRDLGDAHWTVVDRHRGHAAGPTVVGSGPPITCPDGHCAGMGGAAAGADGLRRAVQERADHGVDVIKVMVSGGAMTPGTDVTACQFTQDELRVLVDEAHRAGLAVTGHAHAVPAVQMCLAVGVDGIEHCTCMTARGIAMPEGLAGALAEAGVAVCPTLGQVPGSSPPPQVQAWLRRTGASPDDRLRHIGELHRAGVRLIGGLDAGISPGKPHGMSRESVIDLVGSGLPPAAALAAGTGEAARACGLGGRTGRLAVGLDADLLAVDGDALTDITALRDVRLVVSRGRDVVAADGF
jgi:imidazolonepropionase-like amidohydrolase